MLPFVQCRWTVPYIALLVNVVFYCREREICSQAQSDWNALGKKHCHEWGTKCLGRVIEEAYGWNDTWRMEIEANIRSTLSPADVHISDETFACVTVQVLSSPFDMFANYSILWLNLALLSQASALSYYLDSTCSGKITQAVIDEVKSMASEGSSRLKRSDDQVMAAAFRQVFMVDKSNTASYSKVTSKNSSCSWRNKNNSLV